MTILEKLVIHSNFASLIGAAVPASHCAKLSAVPLFEDRVPAGFPSPAADYIEQGLDFNQYLVSRQAATFVFTVSGDSMSGIGILNGDKVVVDRGVDARHGHVVVAVINGEHTLKRLWVSKGVVELRPENPSYPVLRLSGDDTLNIFGVVVGLVRRFRE